MSLDANINALMPETDEDRKRKSERSEDPAAKRQRLDDPRPLGSLTNLLPPMVLPPFPAGTQLPPMVLPFPPQLMQMNAMAMPNMVFGEPMMLPLPQLPSPGVLPSALPQLMPGQVAGVLSQPQQMAQQQTGPGSEQKSGSRQAKFVWTPELHERFLAACASLGGIEVANASDIQAAMASLPRWNHFPMPPVKRQHIANHLARERRKLAREGTSSFREKIVWTPELDIRFGEALQACGGLGHATPEMLYAKLADTELTLDKIAARLAGITNVAMPLDADGAMEDVRRTPLKLGKDVAIEPFQGDLNLVFSIPGHVRWTTELHEHFVKAVNALGGYRVARPQAVLQLMNIPSLTLFSVKSHLQTYVNTYSNIARAAGGREDGQKEDGGFPEAVKIGADGSAEWTPALMSVLSQAITELGGIKHPNTTAEAIVEKMAVKDLTPKHVEPMLEAVRKAAEDGGATAPIVNLPTLGDLPEAAKLAPQSGPAQLMPLPDYPVGGGVALADFGVDGGAGAMPSA